MKVRVGNWPNYDEIDLNPGEQLCFDEVPGRPTLKFEENGNATWRTTEGGHRVRIIPEASNSVELGVEK